MFTPIIYDYCINECNIYESCLHMSLKIFYFLIALRPVIGMLVWHSILFWNFVLQHLCFCVVLDFFAVHMFSYCAFLLFYCIILNEFIYIYSKMR